MSGKCPTSMYRTLYSTVDYYASFDGFRCIWLITLLQSSIFDAKFVKYRGKWANISSHRARQRLNVVIILEIKVGGLFFTSFSKNLSLEFWMTMCQNIFYYPHRHLHFPKNLLMLSPPQCKGKNIHKPRKPLFCIN